MPDLKWYHLGNLEKLEYFNIRGGHWILRDEECNKTEGNGGKVMQKIVTRKATSFDDMCPEYVKYSGQEML